MNDMNTILPDIKLRFNLDHPNLEECYAFGYECALAEMAEEANPYREGSLEHEHWSEGWWAGFYGEKPLFDLSYAPVEEGGFVEKEAANDGFYQNLSNKISAEFFTKVLKITGALAATAMVGYQVLDLVA
ncbi:hypothetical protein [Legionella jordanis]|uniref:Transmission trait enhancer protein LetE n=1 Tax=Legionella jordanis TaxID=456 RepID=A0A0W0VEE8_9GAMM|nr:hypothetical protein [Legionella jordanis]KTD18182.1 transmission trait enhancer protein LetE [Legionella jordanis]RMX01144.1 transmission trait enhancer LetE [Legionella jordanis]RMX21374.1 transmission trait enhancer LetE [Legionella jordanis]VEH13725.1 transmission trait enhancer LetE [Legionella jordanis]HAT8714564.1 transmission trait enhancer LetE [Legionella jordanis]